MAQTFQEMTDDIIRHPLFIELKDCPHHGGENSLYAHSVSTAKCAYRLARRFHLKEDRVRALTRAALLHDFFGYDWQSDRHRRYMRRYSGWNRVKHMHAFIHGSHAANRASRVFGLDQRQQSAITSHMFPLAPMPRNSEAWLLTLADKMVASKEMGETVGWYARGLRRKLAVRRQRSRA
ncbi:MAG: HD domain-containing protein [Oscillospiraceae bacterium]|nr:HD domain-containing protein [Oscillospiraceae bacterium]